MEHRGIGTVIVQDRGSLSLENQSCDGVAVLVDGTEVGQPFEVNQIPVASVRAVEFYTGPATTPPELRSSKSACGTLAIWTR